MYSEQATRQTSQQAYRRVDIETSSQGKLIVMLFNGAIQRAEEAGRQIAAGNNNRAHEHLVRAQDILAELRSALNPQAGEIALQLGRVYEYLNHLLVRANIRKDAQPLQECLAYLRELRDTWEKVFQEVETAGESAPEPALNPHGSSVLNVSS